MKLTNDWLMLPSTHAVCQMLTNAGQQAYFVGGCVRNAVIGAPVTDLDITTDALPEQTVKLAEDAGLKAIPTGIEHGTITVMSGGVAHEITTMRRDVATDGRRAVVAFTDDIAQDALRRDFTMNALYAAPDGTVLDPLGQGLTDLHDRKVRFIEDARMRIKEDYLRTLRYFRFHAWYGDTMGGPDPEALAAIADNLAGLETLSNERVGSEILKLLAAEDPAPALAAMRSTGVMATILPGANDRSIGPMTVLESQVGLDPDPVRRLAVLGGFDADLRLSNPQKKALKILTDGIASPTAAAELGYRHGLAAAKDILVLRAALFETPLGSDYLNAAERGAEACFPVKAADLMPELQGAALGKRLKQLEARWVESDFALTKEELFSS